MERHSSCQTQRRWQGMLPSSIFQLLVLFALTCLVSGQQVCYFGPGATNRGPANLVPCNSTGTSTCCLLGDTCLSGNTCYNYLTGDLYQYGCTDITYKDASCPYKCGFDPVKSPWTALEYCSDVSELADTWVCHAPESCGCAWNATYDLLVLAPIQCQEMGSNARVALYAPSTLAPYVSLPSTVGGSTGYYSPLVISGTSTWVSTAVAGYTPTPFTELTTYRAPPTTPLLIQAGVSPAPSTYAAAVSYTPPNSTASSAAASSSSSSPSTSSSTPTTSSSSTNNIAPATSSPAVASTSHLSTGAKVGIGIGSAFGGILLLAVLFRFFIMAAKHRRQRESVQPGIGGQPGDQYGQSPPLGYYPQGAGGQWAPYPASGSGMHVDEMRKPVGGMYPVPTTSPIAELSVDDGSTVHENGIDDLSCWEPEASAESDAYKVA